MRVLDIDLDFFLADTCPLAALGERPALPGHEPWPEEKVRRYLEVNLGLDALRPVPGRVFETHDGALLFWEELIRSGRLSHPFEVTHVDAHSDLGIGFPGPDMVLSGALTQSMAARTDTAHYLQLKQLDEANYLLYALAFRRISKLENVRNPKSKPDMPEKIVSRRDADGLPTLLRLIPPLPELFEKMNGKEPEVIYREYGDCESFRAEGEYGFMSLAVSPRYAPKEADALIGVIKEYMTDCPES